MKANEEEEQVTEVPVKKQKVYPFTHGAILKYGVLVCIANIKTGEVLRIRQSMADEFVQKKDTNWAYTTKQIYKQYINSLRPGSNIPASKFIADFENTKGEKKTQIINVCIGHISHRINKRRSSDNKKGKYYFQTIPANTTIQVDKDGNETEVFHEARVIKHLKAK